MININKITCFEWDKGNTDKNPEKHNVQNFETEQIFFNKPLLVLEADTDNNENRFYALGKSDKDRMLFVVFTVRENLIRIISSRDMSKKERIIYNEKAEEDTGI